VKEAGPATPEEVYVKFRDHLERLSRMRDRAGEDFTDLALVQLLTTEEFVNSLGRALFGTDGHGRILHPEKTTA
jgi:hypothetical protein